MGILSGVDLAIHMSITHLSIEVDSKVAAGLCLDPTRPLHSTHSLLAAINRRFQSFNSWEIHHEFQEANGCANRLAAHGHGLNFGCHIFFTLPSSISFPFVVDAAAQSDLRICLQKPFFPIPRNVVDELKEQSPFLFPKASVLREKEDRNPDLCDQMQSLKRFTMLGNHLIQSLDEVQGSN
ncbi:hypothetical protein PIB30_018295 [Stylosanthes scabra]|uniref:RNase H type-1 domain-containing protein n=1 Tax=Stylosanthes scabra TaxID=79078 RepID=A0ABU6Y8J2_9FABA|nr:hypothetical protein [Stylosanthes scabra]